MLRADEQQHNIMALVGNGFDIQVLNSLKKHIKTSYHDFYNFLVWQKIDEFNILFNQMKSMKNKYEEDPDINHNLQNWSDFESGIISICEGGRVRYSDLEESLEELRSYFSIFLNEVVTPEVNNNLGKHAQENSLANNTFQKFLGDLSDDDIVKCEFPKKTHHYNLYNWQIFNFNFTSLLDNYMYLDRKQFNPALHITTVDTNYYFYPNPRSVGDTRDMGNNGDTIWSSYIISDVVHPHGYQNVPKSMLFGVNSRKQIGSAGGRKLNSFVKPYWAQNDLKYAHLFEDTDLYIIFGMSLGVTDQWWWRKIVDSLETSDSELILYNYCHSASEVLQETVKEHFMKASGWVGEDTRKSRIMDKIYVVNFDNNTPRFAFSMTPPTEL
ncbi:AbiH family protein [Rothia aeria]|uniref:AbiH family protein n=1 Tax=Rothia aeria TaxID=172042 RepID=UPI0028E31BBD|nr:AbiH family protein [Rothia aeria]